jgi:hypothetical protein
LRDVLDFEVTEWDLSFEESMLEDVLGTAPKDLAIIEPSLKIIAVLENHKQFYEIAKLSQAQSEDALVAFGTVCLKRNDNVPSGTSLGVTMSEYKEEIDRDYIVSVVSAETCGTQYFGEEPISSYQGLSGGGLWKIVKENEPQLVGIAIAQDLSGYDEKVSKDGLLYFIGSKGISHFLDVKEYSSRPDTKP